VGNLEIKIPLGIPRRKWWIILGWILERGEGVVCTGFIWLRVGTIAGRL
jgi:hypothetical protein